MFSICAKMVRVLNYMYTNGKVFSHVHTNGGVLCYICMKMEMDLGVYA